MPEIQMSLLDNMPEIVLDAKQAGMQKVARNMNPDWGNFAYRCISEIAIEKEEFTSDDVDDRIMSHPIPERPVTHDKRALGPIMRRASINGLIMATDRIIRSNRQKLHNSPRMVWRSLIHPLNAGVPCSI